MASRTRTLNPRTRQNTVQRQPAASPQKSEDNDSSKRQQKYFRSGDGFMVVEPDAARRERIANAAAREEAQVRQHHAQRRQEVVRMMNQTGQTAHRLGGGNVDMEEVRRRQVAQAEAQLRRANRFPAVSNLSDTLPEPDGNKLSDGRGTPEDLNAARKKIVEKAESQFRNSEKH